jgi:hypothetical protein
LNEVDLQKERSMVEGKDGDEGRKGRTYMQDQLVNNWNRTVSSTE